LGKKKKRKKLLEQKLSSGKEIEALGKVATKKKKKKLQQVKRIRVQPNWPLTALAGTGMLLTAYLALTTWLGTAPLYCAEGSTCDIVQRSRWGTFLKLPTSFWGFLTYSTLAYIGFRVRDIGRHWKLAWVVSFIGLGYSIYLNSISLFVIEAACIYCLASLSIMAIILGVVFSQRPKELPSLNFKTWASETLVVTLVFIGGMHLHYSGVFDPMAGPEDPYLKGLALHLSKEDAMMYGAYW
jgi:uncharacterized membrane protein